MRQKDCAKRPKGIDKESRRRLSNTAISRQSRRCKSAGGSSGKSNNAGAPVRYERGGLYAEPGPRRPHSVEATAIR